MRQFKPKGVLERSAGADLSKRTLSSIPTIYGRLVYLASLRDPNSGVYRHHGLGATFGREESIQALELSHTKTFREWLKLALREKSSDLIDYLSGLGDPRGVVVRHWLRSRGYLMYIPDAATKAERALYTSDVEALLSTLTPAVGVEAPGPPSSPRK